MKNISYIVYVDDTVDPTDLSLATWYAANNIEPDRDCFTFKYDTGYAGMALDGTRKTKALDGFERDWPNVIVMDDDTIKKVDEKWEKLGLGEFIQSPSLKYSNLIIGKGAVSGETRSYTE